MLNFLVNDFTPSLIAVCKTLLESAVHVFRIFIYFMHIGNNEVVHQCQFLQPIHLSQAIVDHVCTVMEKVIPE